MNTTSPDGADDGLVAGLNVGDSSIRLRAAMTAGTRADPGLVGALVARCAIEPDFFVRDMLTWALTRLPASVTVPALRFELQSTVAQARSQALHSLSKIGDPAAWSAITPALLHDADDEVARAAWRTAVLLVPSEMRGELAQELTVELGRGGSEIQRSLTRALVALGDVAGPFLTDLDADVETSVRVHAIATSILLHDPELGFAEAVAEASAAIARTQAP